MTFCVATGTPKIAVNQGELSEKLTIDCYQQVAEVVLEVYGSDSGKLWPDIPR